MDKIEVGTRLVEKATGSFSAVEAVFRAKQIGGDEIVTFYKIRGQFLVAYPYDELSKYYMLPIGGEQPMNAREDLILIAAEATEAMKAAKSLLENEMRTNDLLRDQLANEISRHRSEQNAVVDGFVRVLAGMSANVDSIEREQDEPYWLRMIIEGNKAEAVKEIGGSNQPLVYKSLVELIMALAKYWEVE